MFQRSILSYHLLTKQYWGNKHQCGPSTIIYVLRSGKLLAEDDRGGHARLLQEYDPEEQGRHGKPNEVTDIFHLHVILQEAVHFPTTSVRNLKCWGQWEHLTSIIYENWRPVSWPLK